jgi:hypothetical protein
MWRTPLLTFQRWLKLFQARDASCLAGELQDVHAGIGAINDIDVAAIVGFHIVALDGDLTAILAIHLDATLRRGLGD